MRKEIEITIEDGRDAGKTFKIVEMSAVQMDRWVTKALRIIGKSGGSISTLASMDITELLMSVINGEEIESNELLDELLSCASFKKDGLFVAMKGSLVESVIEEWLTLFRLRNEALKLNIGFLEQGGESESK